MDSPVLSPIRRIRRKEDTFVFVDLQGEYKTEILESKNL